MGAESPGEIVASYAFWMNAFIQVLTSARLVLGATLLAMNHEHRVISMRKYNFSTFELRHRSSVTSRHVISRHISFTHLLVSSSHASRNIRSELMQQDVEKITTMRLINGLSGCEEHKNTLLKRPETKRRPKLWPYQNIHLLSSFFDLNFLESASSETYVKISRRNAWSRKHTE